MKIAKGRNRMLAQVSRFAVGSTIAMMAMSNAVMAQEAEEAETSDEIVVTGFRASLENAINEKKNQDQIVESVSAEDIGKLPDASIGESIARLPGLTSQRISGRAGTISVRGFGPDFSSTLLNGRQQTSTNDNRGIEFDQYPSEIVSSVNVYKSPSASLVGQGLVGTIDIRTVRPLDAGKQTIAFGARGAYTDLGKLNSGSSEMGYRAFGTYIDQFADDTLGIALSASYSDEPYQTEEFEAWGYPTGGADNTALIGGVKPFVTSSKLKRLGLNGTLQYKISDNFTLTADGFYSDFDDTTIKRGIEVPLAWSGATLSPTGIEIKDNQVVGGTFSGVEVVVNNHNYLRQAKLYSGGLNLAYGDDDGWKANMDFGYSRTDRRELILESNAGTGNGPGVGATDTLTFESGPRGTTFTSQNLDYGDYNLIKLTSPLGWGGGQVGYYNDRIVDDELMQFQSDVEKEFEDGFISSVKFGANYVKREKTLFADEYFLRLAGTETEVVVPAEYQLRPTDLGYIGLGPVVSYNPTDLLDAGIYRLERNTASDVLFKSFTVKEDVMSAFVQANIKQELGSGTLTGNVGVQAINTDQRSSGFIVVGNNVTRSTLGDTYWDILPSLNLSMRFDSDFVIRFAAAREIQRPRLDDMRVNYGYGYDTALGVIKGSGGNPKLRPYRATAFDLNFEKYFGSRGYLAAQFFWKKLNNYVYEEEIEFDFTGFPFPTPPVGVTITDPVGILKVPVNGKGGKIYGVELAGTLPFDTFISALEGFGITGGASYTKSKISPTPGAPSSDIPGYSRWVANGTAYFERGGFSLRGSARYRSTFLGDFSGLGANRQRRRALAETIIDGQVGYDFQEGSSFHGLSMFIQGFNLTNEPFVAINPGQELQVLNHQNYGRRFMAGFTYKF